MTMLTMEIKERWYVTWEQPCISTLRYISKTIPSKRLAYAETEHPLPLIDGLVTTASLATSH